MCACVTASAIESCEPSAMLVSTSNDMECARDPRDQTSTPVSVTARSSRAHSLLPHVVDAGITDGSAARSSRSRCLSPYVDAGISNVSWVSGTLHVVGRRRRYH